MKFGNFKMNLQKKIFVLMLSVGVAAFIFMGIVAITGMYMVNNKINNAGQQMSENTSGFTEQFAENQIKTSLSIQAMEKAELVQQKLENAMEDVVYMADVMMRIMKHPGNYQPRSLPNPHQYGYGAALRLWRIGPGKRPGLQYCRYAGTSGKLIPCFVFRFKKRVSDCG